MTIDERLEALTQSLELARVNQALTALAEAQVKTEEAMARLAHIAEIQDQRITRVESR